MAWWTTHLMVADQVMEAVPQLHRYEYCVGNIAPDCNVENADWTAFDPPRQVTHWMSAECKTAADCERFLQEYLFTRSTASAQEEDFLWGYYTHLVVDAEFQRTIRDEARVHAAWQRILEVPQLRQAAQGMPPTWDSIKRLISKEDRLKDIASFEREYLDNHPGSGFLTEIVGLRAFPDYLDFLPPNAIPRKVQVLAGVPQRSPSRYPWLAMTREEYQTFIDRSVCLSVQAIQRYRGICKQ